MSVLMVVLLAVQFTGAADKAPPRHAQRIEQWFREVQRFAIPYRKQATQASNKLEHDRLVDEFAEQFDPSKIKFRVRVTGVSWANGIAKVYTENELPSDKGARLRIYRRSPFEILLTEAEAADIKPGTWFEFEGTMTFQKGGYGATSRCQALYHVDERQFKIVGLVGTFVSRDYTCVLNGEEVPGRWTVDEVSASDKTESRF